MADTSYEVGDSFEGSPIELNRWVSPIWALGGRVEFDGNFAKIVYLPPSNKVEKAPEPVVPAPVKEVVVEPTPVKDEPKVIEAVVEVAKTVVEAPKLKPVLGRPKKVDTEEKGN